MVSELNYVMWFWNQITLCGFGIKLRYVVLESTYVRWFYRITYCGNIKTTLCGTISKVTNNVLKEQAKNHRSPINKKNGQLTMQ